MEYFAAIEAGGTNFSCAIGSSEGKIIQKQTFPTTTPEKTLKLAFDFFKQEDKKNRLKAFGVACFGPLDLDKSSKNYGQITTTPKTAWAHFNIVEAIKKEFSISIGFDTDVNGAALGEQRWGAAKSIDTFIYITVGTGIGVGAIVENKLMHGLIHPEMGHIMIPRHKSDNLKSKCPYHENCLEGLAAGPAIMQRWQVKSATDLPSDHEGWALEAYYLGTAISIYTLCLSPKKVIIGGGVLNNKSLIDKIRIYTQKSLNGYVKDKMILSEIDKYIVLPKLTGLSGLYGALALAQDAKG